MAAVRGLCAAGREGELMARFLPDTDLSSIEVNSERAVARALAATLDDDWVVFHSYPWLRAQSHSLREGEMDFILVHRQHGLLVVEVKGGSIRFEPDRQHWFQSQRKLKRSPFEQARKNMHALVEQVKERIATSQFPCVHGYAVVFPDCDYTGSLPPGVHESILLGSRQMRELGQAMQQGLAHWGRRPAMPQEVFDVLLDALKSSFNIVPSLLRTVEKNEEILVQLTEEQARVLQGLEQHKRVLVEGAAGTGKTLLALRRARRFAEQGLNTLYVCFNSNLAAAVRGRESHPNLKIQSFHSLCRELSIKGLGQFSVPAGEEVGRWWSDTAPELLDRALDEVEDRWDAIVVDEAQDFEAGWWVPLERMSRSRSSHLYIFYDRSQNLYATELSFPRTETRYVLMTNCRNTRKIAGTCGRVLGAEIPVSLFAPEGLEVVVERHAAGPASAEACQRKIDKLVRAGLKLSQIAVLSRYAPSNSSLAAMGQTFTDDLETWRQGRAVWLSSIKAFKGLEAEALILVDLTDFKPGFLKQDLYVACSRARHLLFALTSSNEVAQALASD